MSKKPSGGALRLEECRIAGISAALKACVKSLAIMELVILCMGGRDMIFTNVEGGAMVAFSRFISQPYPLPCLRWQYFIHVTLARHASFDNHLSSGNASYHCKVTPAQWLLTLLILRNGRASVSFSYYRAIENQDGEQ